MTVLAAMPPEHRRRWLSVCEHAREPILDLVGRGVPPNRILVVVAPAQSHQAWALIEHYPEHVPYWGDDESDGIVAVLGTTGVGEAPEDRDDDLLSYLARLPEGQFGLLVYGPDGRTVVSGCVMPPGAATQKTYAGLNNGGAGS